jgi:hypothetical protein
MSSKSLKKPQISYLSLFFSKNVFKKAQNRSKRLTPLEKASISL